MAGIGSRSSPLVSVTGVSPYLRLTSIAEDARIRQAVERGVIPVTVATLLVVTVTSLVNPMQAGIAVQEAE
jgi:hypothetical protein